jgi:ubiquitin-activating enzyme E1
VGSISNLRARNYNITEVPNFKVKLIAGKIIPALATTTAMIVGAVGIEIIKKVLGMKEAAFYNSYMNLALPLWVFSEPMAPIQHKDKAYDDLFLGPVKAVPPNFTSWDKF